MKLPEGVYAVSEAFAGKNGEVSFVFKGVCYEAQVGRNAFATLEELVLSPLCPVREPFCGYDAVAVLVLPEGVYHNGKGPTKAQRLRTYFPCAMAVLGEHAGESPNGAQLRAAAWQGGSVIEGSFYFGSLGVKDGVDGTLTFDGLTLRTTRLADDRTRGENVGLAVKNCVFEGFCVYSLVRAKAMAEGAPRFLRLQNVRAAGIDDRAGEGRLLEVGSGSLFVDGLYVADTEKFLGFTDYSGRDISALDEMILKNVLVERCACTRGLRILLPQDSRAQLTLENCQFLDAVPPEDPVLSVNLPAGAGLTLRRVRFEGCSARGAVEIDGDPDAVVLEEVSQRGFAALCTRKPPRRTDVEGFCLPAEDPHEAAPADMQALDRLYAGMQAYYGDLHCHSDSGGSSDGKTPIEEYVPGMERMGVDFAAILDHRQMRHFFLPCWDEKYLICGTEPGTTLPDTRRPEKGRSFDYTMIFPDKQGLRRVLEQFPAYGFSGDPMKSFSAPSMSWEQVGAVCAAVHAAGGLMAHAHPRQMMDSDEPLDYCFSDEMFLETVHVDNRAFSTVQNRALWIKLLKLGKRLRTYGSSDSHGPVSNRGLTAVFSPRHHSADIFRQVRQGNCVAGGVAVRMALGDTPMGGVAAYRPGQVLSISVEGFHPAHYCDDGVYSLRVYTQRGLVCARAFRGQRLCLGLLAQPRSYYRAEIWNESDGCPVALTNPIWLE